MCIVELLAVNPKLHRCFDFCHISKPRTTPKPVKLIVTFKGLAYRNERVLGVCKVVCTLTGEINR